MTALTRRRSVNSHRTTWHIYFEDVRVGTIGRRAGVPTSADQWSWSLGFYPGTEPGAHQYGSAESFGAARTAFDIAWERLRPTLTGESFESWRRSRDFHAWKYRMWDTGHRMPTQTRDGWPTCFCGEPVPIGCEAYIDAVHRGIGA
jgi:hypothetical protein